MNRFILPDLKKISETVDLLLDNAGLTEGEISAVFLTGGSSLVRRIQKLFVSRFGEEKVKCGMETFTSVAHGLALYKKQLIHAS